MRSRVELKMTMSDKPSDIVIFSSTQQVTPFDSKFPTKNISSQ